MEAPEKIYLTKNLLGELRDGWDALPSEVFTNIEYIRKDTLVKYLYEEKGYPITLNGELLHWDELNKHLAEYNKWKKDAFIKKAYLWLKDNTDRYLYNTGGIDEYIPKCGDKMIEDFKKYMEE